MGSGPTGTYALIQSSVRALDQVIEELEHPLWSRYHDQSLWYKAGGRGGEAEREELVGLGWKLRRVVIRARRAIDYWIRMCGWLERNKAGLVENDTRGGEPNPMGRMPEVRLIWSVLEDKGTVHWKL